MCVCVYSTDKMKKVLRVTNRILSILVLLGRVSNMRQFMLIAEIPGRV